MRIAYDVFRTHAPDVGSMWCCVLLDGYLSNIFETRAELAAWMFRYSLTLEIVPIDEWGDE